MSESKPVLPVKLFCGIIAVNKEIISISKNELINLFGEIDLESDFIPFSFTDYYKKEMGDNLIRKFVSFGNLIDPVKIASIKIKTNNIEDKFKLKMDSISKRQVNLDPGYISASTLVLATMKNFSHRIYLGMGVYGEVTLNFKKSGCVYFPWTYPDFKTKEYTKFFINTRDILLMTSRLSNNDITKQ